MLSFSPGPSMIQSTSLFAPFAPGRPCAAECHQIHDLLVSVHDKCPQPHLISLPSLVVAGCGEVLSILDAVPCIVTSGATVMAAANKVLASLVSHYGVATSDPHISRVDSPVDNLANVIRPDGFNNKARAIQSIITKMRNTNADGSLSLEYIWGTGHPEGHSKVGWVSADRG